MSSKPRTRNPGCFEQLRSANAPDRGQTRSQTQISVLSGDLESSDRRFHQYSCGRESDDCSPEVGTEWVKT